MKSEPAITGEIKMDTEVKEKLRWFQILASLYEIATPHIMAFTGLECQALEQRAVDIEMIYHNAGALRQLLAVIKNIPEPSEDEISRTKKHFETALSSCINASEDLLKYVQFNEQDPESQTQLGNFINSLTTARKYSESTYKRLNFSPE
jgi:hypothetical protein